MEISLLIPEVQAGAKGDKGHGATSLRHQFLGSIRARTSRMPSNGPTMMGLNGRPNS